MVNLKGSDIRISLLEKVLVNFALPSDLLYHTIKSTYLKDQYSDQTITERIRGLSRGKIQKYHKLLVCQRLHGGEIPQRTREVCMGSPCGKMRLALTYFRKE